ncbi:MAG: LacI family DNA-binding transcriptional regulator, partial [Parvibaculaceae bacterium]
MSRPTIADVAKLAGVSAQTVSNYLTGRNKPRTSNLAKLEKAIEA